MSYAPSQPTLALDPTPALPAACTQAAFARLLLVSEALVSRWKSEDRLDLDRVGHVRTVPTLLRLAQTLDQTRGGRRGSATAGVSTLQRIEALIATHTGARSVSELEKRIVELGAQLAAERDRSVKLHAWAMRLAESREQQARTLRARIGDRFEYLAAAQLAGELASHLDLLFRDVTGDRYGAALSLIEDEDLAEFSLTSEDDAGHNDDSPVDREPFSCVSSPPEPIAPPRKE